MRVPCGDPITMFSISKCLSISWRTLGSTVWSDQAVRPLGILVTSYLGTTVGEGWVRRYDVLRLHQHQQHTKQTQVIIIAVIGIITFIMME